MKGDASGAYREILVCLQAIDPHPTPLREVGLGLAVAAAAIGLRWGLDPWLDHRLPYVFPIAAVSVACRLGTWRAGVICGVFSAVLANYLFVDPRLRLVVGREEATAAAAVALLMGLMLLLSHRAQRAVRVVDELAARLVQADEQKSHLLAVVAHELRNPLSALRHAGEVLKGSCAGKAERPMVDLIARQVMQIERLIDDLTDAALIQRGKITLTKAPASLRLLVETALEAGRERLHARRQRVEASVPDLMVDVDAVRMVQVLSNLVQNASKFSPDDSIIRISAWSHGDNVLLTVADAGTGIPHDRLEWVFDSYAQLSPARGGMGIGLALVRRLVELHGGRVRAMNREANAGAVFELSLPAATAAPSPAPAGVAAQRPGAA